MARILCCDGEDLKFIRIQAMGCMDNHYFCTYRYKDECEPEENKRRWPNKEDRWYENNIGLSTILAAQKDGCEIIDNNGYLKKAQEC